MDPYRVGLPDDMLPGAQVQTESTSSATRYPREEGPDAVKRDHAKRGEHKYKYKTHHSVGVPM
eukprot:1182759-Prorocentrum_minimum.AAC.2